MINNHCLSIPHHDSQSLAQHNSTWFTTFGTAWQSMIHSHWLIIAHHVNHGVLFWNSGCESWCVILKQWLWIMVCYSGPVVVNHGVLCWASGCESWSVMLCKWLWIMVCYAGPVVVNHGVVCWDSGCEPWCAMLSQWLWIINHWLSITPHDSQPLVQHNTPWFTTTGSE
jgi:hypothetical protein